MGIFPIPVVKAARISTRFPDWAAPILPHKNPFDNLFPSCYIEANIAVFALKQGKTRGYNVKAPMINLGILAHADAGKTTVTEQLLLLSGSIRKAGSVDSGTTQTDWLDVERRRGISVRSASVVLEKDGVQIHLIDTPGHVDFLGEVERCLSVLDGAVLVLSAVEGVQAQTRLLWRALDKLKIPVLLLVNKIDRMGCDLSGVLEQLRQECSPKLWIPPRVEYHGTDG